MSNEMANQKPDDNGKDNKAKNNQSSQQKFYRPKFKGANESLAMQSEETC